jgi:hypothetical protein
MDGWVDPAFRGVREVFEASFADGRNLGAAVAAFVGGRAVAGPWPGRGRPLGRIGGCADRARLGARDAVRDVLLHQSDHRDGRAAGRPGHGGGMGRAGGHVVAIAFVPNLRRDWLAGDRRAYDLVTAVYDAL